MFQLPCSIFILINKVKRLSKHSRSQNFLIFLMIGVLLMLSYFLNHLLSGGADGGSVVRFLWGPWFSQIWGPSTNCLFFVNQTKHKKFCKFIITRVILLLKEMFYFKNTPFYFNTFTQHFACTSCYKSGCTVFYFIDFLIILYFIDFISRLFPYTVSILHVFYHQIIAEFHKGTE